jgi:FkbM family methyltransferase
MNAANIRMSLKHLLRAVLNRFHLDLTKNLEYDRLTKAIMKRVIRPGTNCIDIGCHKGEILKYMLRYSPQGKHFAFEPIPVFYNQLQKEFGTQVSILPYALSDHQGEASFCFVKNAPAYSGLKPRRYDRFVPVIEEITVTLQTLDEAIPEDVPVHFIKIDVEGGEYDVLRGARRLLQRHRPVVIFESGMGSGMHYGTDPGAIFDFLFKEAGMKLSLMKNFISNKPPLGRDAFIDFYNNEKEYYFVAHP